LEEVRTLIGEANSSGELEPETSRMLERTLNLSDREVMKIMVPLEKIDSVDADLPEEKLLDLITEMGRSRVPLYRGGRQNVIGFIYAKDLLAAWQAHKGINVNEFLRPAYCIEPNKKVFDLLKEFQTGKTHIAFVSDPSGKVMGIVTLEDVLEAILGEILDEYDLKKPQAAKV
jgi:CBS domain containing-hemolysin-like protein